MRVGLRIGMRIDQVLVTKVLQDSRPKAVAARVALEHIRCADIIYSKVHPLGVTCAREGGEMIYAYRVSS